jgi:hypothetical protein
LVFFLSKFQNFATSHPKKKKKTKQNRPRYKGFQNNAPKSPDFDEKNAEIVIFR